MFCKMTVSVLPSGKAISLESKQDCLCVLIWEVCIHITTTSHKNCENRMDRCRRVLSAGIIGNTQLSR